MEVLENPFLIELNENQLIIKKTVSDFAEKNIRPVVMQFDESQEFPMEIITAARRTWIYRRNFSRGIRRSRTWIYRVFNYRGRTRASGPFNFSFSCST